MEEEEEAVQVFVRIRPLNKRELAEQQTIGWDFNETSMLEDTQNGQRVYAFDRCYGPDENNQAVYERVGKPVVLKALEGYNGTVFTYGQTGSGKTFTMRGSDADPGMMILCIRDIFDYIDSHPNSKFKLKVSYMEVYNEEINDLLGKGLGSKNLRIVSEDAVRGAVIGGLVEETVTNGTELMEVLRTGEASRSYGSTEMNAESSRSHTIYRLCFESEDIDESDEPVVAGGFQSSSGASPGGVTRMSFLNLVDLAGSERQKSTGASGKTLKEGANINKSLLALGAVINKLGETSKKVKGSKPVFLPYRDSKLTRILKQSLGGNTLTSILCTVTPAPMHREETVSTLKFGQLCKTIKNSVKSNEIVDERTLIKQYRSMIQELRLQLEEYESGNGGGGGTLQKAQQEKLELQQRNKELEELLLHGGSAVHGGGGDADAVQADLAKSQSANAALLDALNESKRTVKQLQTEVYNLETNISSLQTEVDEIHNLEDLKSAFEDYQTEIQSQIDDDRNKMEREKEALQAERVRTMAEKTHLDEKEGRLGLLLAALDERESKLRQYQTTLKEQQGHWQQSISDLTRREELVEDWQTNHHQREKKLKDWSDQLDKKFQELSDREASLAESEHSFKVQQRGLSEREQRLQVALHRVATSEQSLGALEEKLSSQESYLKVREGELDVKEREISTRRRELEQWDSLLREKDRKVVSEQRQLEEREEILRAQEGKVRARELDCEKKSLDLRQKDAEATILVEKYTALRQDLEARERYCVEQTTKYNTLATTLTTKESSLNSKEIQLKDLEIRFKDTKLREKELEARVTEHNKAVDTFYNVEVAAITSRHAKEMRDLESLVEQQLVVVSNFQTELEKVRNILSNVMKEKDELKSVMDAKSRLIVKLEDDLSILEEEKERLKDEAVAAEARNSPNAEDDSRDRRNKDDDDEDEDGVNDGDSSPVNKQSRTGGQVRTQRSFFAQLSDTQAMLRAVLEMNQHHTPHTRLRATSNDSKDPADDTDQLSHHHLSTPTITRGNQYVPQSAASALAGHSASTAAGGLSVQTLRTAEDDESTNMESKSMRPFGTSPRPNSSVQKFSAAGPPRLSDTPSSHNRQQQPHSSDSDVFNPPLPPHSPPLSAAVNATAGGRSGSTTGNGGGGAKASSAFTREYRVTTTTVTPPARPGNVPVASVTLGLSKAYKAPNMPAKR